MVVARPQRVHGRHDLPGHVRDNARLAQVDPGGRQRPREMGHVGVGGPSRQDLVPDGQHSGGGIGHGVSWAGACAASVARARVSI
jgi:hypothetical protein